MTRVRPDYLDRYSRGDSRVHRLPAAVKLGTALALVTLVATVPLPAGWALLPVVALFIAAVAWQSRVPPGFVLRRLLVLEWLVVAVALLPLLRPGGGALAASMAARSTVCLATMVVLTTVTPFADILTVLRRAHLPAVLVTTLALSYRYVFVLVDELERMQRARRSRTMRGGRRQVWRASASLVGQVFVRSTERAERIYAAMCARGWR